MLSDAVVGRQHARPARGAREARVARAVCAGDTLKSKCKTIASRWLGGPNKMTAPKERRAGHYMISMFLPKSTLVSGKV